MNKVLTNSFIFALVIVLIVAFSGSYASLNIDNLAYVLAIGIDTAIDNKMMVSFQFSTTSSLTESGTTDKSPPLLNTVTASSLSSAIDLMDSYMGKELNFSHCKVIIFSEDFASQGIADEIYTITNDSQIRPSANILISKCTAKYYLDQTKPELENLISKYYEKLTTSSKYTGHIPNATVGEFFDILTWGISDPYAILSGLTNKNSETDNSENSQKDSEVKASDSSIEGDNSAENIGVAVFNGDKFVGELNAIETVSFLTIQNRVNRFLVSIPDPINPGSELDIYLTPDSSTNVKVNTNNSSPFLKLKFSFSGRIYSMTDNSDYLSAEAINSISNSCNKYLESTFSSYLYKTSREFKSDVNGFSKFALNNFATIKDFEAYKWSSNYKNSVFSVEVDTSIKSGMLITGT